jgi:hypothetical protein
VTLKARVKAGRLVVMNLPTCLKAMKLSFCLSTPEIGSTTKTGLRCTRR